MKKLIGLMMLAATMVMAGDKWENPIVQQFTNQAYTVVNPTSGNSTLQYITLKSDAGCTCTVSLITCDSRSTNTLASLITGGSTTNTWPVALNLPWRTGDKLVLTPNTAASVTNYIFLFVEDAVK